MSCFHVTVAALFVASATMAQEGKWVWSGRNFNGAATFPEQQYARPLYRPINDNRPPAPVFETSDVTNLPPVLQPIRPVQGGGRPGILTGPIPSWEQRPGDKLAYRDYEHCKCDYGFNCKSPGIKFYCCFNAKPGLQNGPYDARPPFREREEGGYREREDGYRPRPRPPPQSTYDRPVLVGPGGPTGIIGPGDRPFNKPPYRVDGPEEERPAYHGYGTINDDNFPRPPYDPFGRNANLEAKKNGKKL
ncbi:hypothetical protein C0J52_20006 [Blattella germanica]|nr:hypothetical protein C0J52_20006 [Blattella germanica]